jgi:PKD repeat protein
MKKIFHLVIVTVTLAVVLSQGAPAAEIAGVGIFPSDHIWNTPVDNLPVDPHSASYVTKIGAASSLHPDFGSGLYEGAPIGIPYNIVDNSVAKTTVTFDYDDESDPGPYPVPVSPLIEGGSTGEGDRHMLIIQRDEEVLYELYAAEKQPDGSWHAGSGAIFNLSGYQLRPAGWTSADAAGLAILPGLVRYDEVANGEITHAIRFTAPSTRKLYVWPARHFASGITDPLYPPMGQRFRLKTSFDTSGYPYQARVVLEALKKYGMILSDNGGAWFITGAPDDQWDNDALHTLSRVKGSDFEAVDSSSLIINQDSGQAVTISTVIALPGSMALPTDPDNDGLFEDLSGNGGAGFNDVVLFFRNIDWITDNEPVSAFDFTRNGVIGFQDIVALFREL